jgi:hypothetical protein
MIFVGCFDIDKFNPYSTYPLQKNQFDEKFPVREEEQIPLKILN